MAILQGGSYLASVAAETDLTDAAVALQVIAPDGTTSSPTVSKSGSSASASVPGTQVGIYLLIWTVTGATPDLIQDQFAVEAAQPYLMSISELRDELNLDDSYTLRDSELRRWLRSATTVIENVTGPILPKQRTDVFNGGGPAIVLPFRWVQSISAASETIGQVVYALAEQPLGQSVYQWGYTWDRNTNRIVRRVWGSFDCVFAPGRDNVSFSYTLGMTTIPQDIQQAAARLIEHWWRKTNNPWRAGGMFTSQPSDDDGVAMVGNYEIPNSAMELLEPWRRRPGIF